MDRIDQGEAEPLRLKAQFLAQPIVADRDEQLRKPLLRRRR
jgi:hypothetical protein